MSATKELRIFIDLPDRVSFALEAPLRTRLMYVEYPRVPFFADFLTATDFFATERALAIVVDLVESETYSVGVVGKGATNGQHGRGAS
jgi:hypothetical protein